MKDFLRLLSTYGFVAGLVLGTPFLAAQDADTVREPEDLFTVITEMLLP